MTLRSLRDFGPTQERKQACERNAKTHPATDQLYDVDIVIAVEPWLHHHVHKSAHPYNEDPQSRLNQSSAV